MKGWLRGICRIPRYWKRSKDPHYVRLAVLREALPRFVHGSVTLPFGCIQYADIASLEAQYWAIYVNREYDYQCRDDQPVIIDCGGNIGLSSIWFKQRFPGAKLTVFEPGPELYALLQENMKSCGIRDVTAIEAAVWNKITTLYLNNDSADGGFVRHTSDSGQPVKAVRLSEYIDTPVSLLKLDIEGGEYNVLEDLVISGKLVHIQNIVGELHATPEDGGRVGNFLKLLHDNGFKVSIHFSRSAPALFCYQSTTPFYGLPDGKYLSRFSAWREEQLP